MATINCRECGGVVSTSAKACPHCGAPSSKFKPKMGIGTLLLWGIGFIIFVAITSPKEGGTTGQVAMPQAATTLKTKPPQAIEPIFTDGHICKAAIAVIMGRPVAGMNSSAEGNGAINVSYIRSQDKQKFEYQCKVNVPQVMWRAKIDDSWGRWRDHPDDGKVTFKVEDGVLTVAEWYGGSAANVKYFSLKDF